MGSLSSILSNIKLAITSLTSASNTAVFKKLASGLSINIDNTITEIQNTSNIINANIQANNYGKSGYYINSALYYEYGQTLLIDPITMNWVYSPVDISKRTISQAAFDEVNLTLKVAYIDPSTGNLTNLPGGVLTDFIAYMGLFEIPGIPINITSLTGDVFSGNFQITYYRQNSLSVIQADVIAALITFQTTFVYNGILYLGDLSDFIKQNVPGIRDVEISGTSINGIPFIGSSILNSGYFNYDTNLINSLNTSAPYIVI